VKDFLKKDYLEKYRSPLASVAEPDPVSDLGFMTKNGNDLQLLKMPILTFYFIYLNEGLYPTRSPNLLLCGRFLL
jgi:hypothetical protein